MNEPVQMLGLRRRRRLAARGHVSALDGLWGLGRSPKQE